MLGLLILLVIVVFAALMFARVMPALVALPAMAIVVAALVGLPLGGILNDVIAAGAVRTATPYVAVIAGAMLGRVMMQTGIAEEIIKRAAEFGGDRPLVVAGALMVVTALLFTVLQGLGAIILVGSLVLPIMLSLGLPRRLAATLFLLAFATGFVFNFAIWPIYLDVLGLPKGVIPERMPSFAGGLLAITAAAVALYTLVSARRARGMNFWAVASKEDVLATAGAGGRRVINPLAFLTPFVPLVLMARLEWSPLPAFLAGSLYAVLLVRPRDAIRTLTASAVRGVEDAAPAVILFIGIGMLLNALTLPAVKSALEPLVRSLPLGSSASYVAVFGLLSPLALYRGPLNPLGVGAGVFSILAAAQVLPPLALFAALLSIVQVQNVCDPTNTHNVWVANYTGVRVEEITRATLLTMMLVCAGGLLLGALMFMR